MDILNTIQSALGGGDKKDDLMSTVMGLLGGQGGLNDDQPVRFKGIGRCCWFLGKHWKVTSYLSRSASGSSGKRWGQKYRI